MQPADGSPTGSAQQIDGNLIALQMIQATNSAAEAAQAAVKAVESMKTGSDDKNWYRLLPKPVISILQQEKVKFPNGESGVGNLNSIWVH